MDLIQTGSTQFFGKLILWGIIIFLAFAILRFVIPFILKSQKHQVYIRKILLTSEITIWIFYLCWFIFLFLKSQSFFVVILFSILLFVLYVLGRYWIIDLIAGTIFKSGGQIKKGDYIEKDSYKGIVTKLGSRFLVLENIDGNMIHIPYHKITSSAFNKNETIDQKSGYSFELETSNIDTLEDIKNKIQKSILSLPWSSVHKSPIITLLDQTPERCRLKITVFALDKTFGSKIENHIRELYTTI